MPATGALASRPLCMMARVGPFRISRDCRLMGNPNKLWLVVVCFLACMLAQQIIRRHVLSGGLLMLPVLAWRLPRIQGRALIGRILNKLRGLIR